MAAHLAESEADSAGSDILGRRVVEVGSRLYHMSAASTAQLRGSFPEESYALVAVLMLDQPCTYIYKDNPLGQPHADPNSTCFGSWGRG